MQYQIYLKILKNFSDLHLTSDIAYVVDIVLLLALYFFINIVNLFYCTVPQKSRVDE